MLERFRETEHISEYLDAKENEIEQANHSFT